METWLAVWLATSVFYLVITRSRVYICMRYCRKNGDDSLVVEVYLLKRLIHYNINLPIVRIVNRYGVPWLESEVKTAGLDVETHSRREQNYVKNTWNIYWHNPRKWRGLLKSFRDYIRLYTKFTGKIFTQLNCEKLRWCTRVGTDDAAVTSMIAGSLWVLKSQICRRMKRKMKFIRPAAMCVVPNFAAPVFDMEFECIFSFRLGNVINAIRTLIFR